MSAIESQSTDADATRAVSFSSISQAAESCPRIPMVPISRHRRGRPEIPDGLVVDSAAGHMYWTNMGNLKANDGSILRSDLDGENMTTIVLLAARSRPKQLQLEKKNGKLYWCDREGMRVMRANLDGSNIETLVDTSEGDPRPGLDARKWCVGIAVDTGGRQNLLDPERRRQRRARAHLPREYRDSRKARLPRIAKTSNSSMTICRSRSIWTSILPSRAMYWTDRGDPPRGNTVNRAPMDPAPGSRKDPEILFSHLMEGIGLALDLKGGRMFITDFAGTVYSANLDGSNKKTLLFAEGNLTGIAYVEMPAAH